MGHLFVFAADISSIQLPRTARLSSVSAGRIAERLLNELESEHRTKLRTQRKDAVRKLGISAVIHRSAEQPYDLGASDVPAEIWRAINVHARGFDHITEQL